MQLNDITKHISNMTEEELLEHIRYIRHNKYKAKPAVAKRIQDVEKKTVKHRTSAVNRLINGMSDTDRLELLKKLEEE